MREAPTTTPEHVERFECFGRPASLVVGAPLTRHGPSAAAAVVSARRWLDAFAARTSSLAESELGRLNADPRDTIPASASLRSLIAAATWAAERSGGLVDPTAPGAAWMRPGPPGGAPSPWLPAALRAAPARSPAAPSAEPAWHDVHVDHRAGTVRRPPGTVICRRGIAEALAADVVASALRRFNHFAVDIGGNVRVGGASGWAWLHYYVTVTQPLTREPAHIFELDSGAVATTDLRARLWRDREGRYLHDLLDPSTGEPAWTGLVTAAALAPTAVEAVTLSRAAFLSGSLGARRVLAPHGGVIIDERGRVELIGAVSRARVRTAAA